MIWDDRQGTTVVLPSLYAGDFARLGEQIETLLAAGARVFHFDIGDGHFVPPITIGPVVLRSVERLIHDAGGSVDCHLMVDNPIDHFEELAVSGADSVTFHREVVDEVATVAAAAREHGLGVGIALNPQTAVSEVAAVADLADIVLLMTIQPGYSGQEFRDDSLGRIVELRSTLSPPSHLQVDGGIKPGTAAAARRAGANLFVAGSAVFYPADIAAAYRGLVDAVS